MRTDPRLFPVSDPGLNAYGMTHSSPRSTEAAAARLIEPRSGTQRAAVLGEIRKAGAFGRTDEELSAQLSFSENSIRPRRVELLEAGWITDSGRTRKTIAGRDATVWTAREE